MEALGLGVLLQSGSSTAYTNWGFDDRRYSLHEHVEKQVQIPD